VFAHTPAVGNLQVTLRSAAYRVGLGCFILSHKFNMAPPARTALLVTAHPDDESMFFVPTLQQLVAGGYNVHVLCLSTGQQQQDV
jgi:hypothetical protein